MVLMDFNASRICACCMWKDVLILYQCYCSVGDPDNWWFTSSKNKDLPVFAVEVRWKQIREFGWVKNKIKNKTCANEKTNFYTYIHFFVEDGIHATVKTKF